MPGRIKLLFVTQDLAIGGGTSSLSSLYTHIENLYDIRVLLLSNQGDAVVSYRNAIIYPDSLTNAYYNYGKIGRIRNFKQLQIAIVKTMRNICRIIGINTEKYIALRKENLFREVDYVISFGEGAATSFCQYVNKPKVTWIHYDITNYPYDDKIAKLLMAYNKVVCVSDTIANSMKLQYRELEQKIISIHNIVDEKRISLLSEDNIDMCVEGGFNIISIGRISPVKRFSEIPYMAYLLKTKGLRFCWRILGPANDVEELEKLYSEIDKYSVDDCVKWMGSKKNPYPYLKKSDMYVSTSYIEACPMVFTEARILNVPIVSANFKSSYEFIDNDVDGVIRPIDKIPEEIFKIATNSELRQRLISNAHKRGTGNEDTIKKFNHLICSL